MVAILALTFAFQAGINPLGGVWQDTGFHKNTLPYAPHEYSSPSELVQHYVGRSVMLYVDPKRFKYFYILNSITFFLSTSVITLLFARRVFSFWIFDVSATVLSLYSILAMVITASISMSFVSSDKFFNEFHVLGPSRYISEAISILPMFLVIASGFRVIHVVCFRIIWFLIRSVSGRSCTTPVESGEVVRP